MDLRLQPVLLGKANIGKVQTEKLINVSFMVMVNQIWENGMITFVQAKNPLFVNLICKEMKCKSKIQPQGMHLQCSQFLF